MASYWIKTDLLWAERPCECSKEIFSFPSAEDVERYSPRSGNSANDITDIQNNRVLEATLLLGHPSTMLKLITQIWVVTQLL